MNLKFLLVFFCLEKIASVISLDGCKLAPLVCMKSKYRSHDGSCNNLKNPFFGTPYSRYARLLPPKYGDGKGTFAVSKSGKPLPNPRTLSINFYPDVPKTDNQFTLNTMQFGQIITHDMSLTVLADVAFVCCSDSGRKLDPAKQPPRCLPIDIPANDPVYSPLNQTCLGFIRTTTDRDMNCTGVSQYDEQLSQVTSYRTCLLFMEIAMKLTKTSDCSKMVYCVPKLERGNSGRFALQILQMNVSSISPLTPVISTALVDEITSHGHSEVISKASMDDPRSKFLDLSSHNCVLDSGKYNKSSDDRLNQNPQLTLLQIIFIREHNRIAGQLFKLNPHWSDEKIYQESRKIAIAEYAQICYYEWLPLILGEDILYSEKILFKTKGQVRDFDERIDPAVLNEHAIAAFKYFHSTIAGQLGHQIHSLHKLIFWDHPEMQKSLQENPSSLAELKHIEKIFSVFSECRAALKNVSLKDWYFDPQVLEDDNNFDGFVRGLNTQPQMASDRYHDKAVTSELFFQGVLGLDLKAIDIHRSRNHGLASYNDLRKYCALKKATKFRDFLDVISEKHVSLLERFYEHPDDVDLVVGGSLERHIPGALAGPTFRCIMLKQFRRTRTADRFWYENEQFTTEQLRQIRKSSISRLMCDNSNVKKMQLKGFIQISQWNPLKNCDELPAINLSLWKET